MRRRSPFPEREFRRGRIHSFAVGVRSGLALGLGGVGLRDYVVERVGALAGVGG